MIFFNFFLLSLFSDIGNIQILFPFLAKVYFQKIIMIIPIFGLFSDHDFFNNIAKRLNSKQGKVLIFLVSWMIISVPFAVYPGGSFAFLTQRFWKVIVMVFLVLAYASSKEVLDKIIWTYILAIGFLGVLTVMASGASRMAIKEDIYDANDTALQFVLALPFVVWKYRSSKGFTKALTGLICLALIVGIVETKSRGGFIGLLAVFAVTALQIKRIERGGLLKMLIPLIAVGVIIYYYGSTTYFDRISTIIDPNDYNYTGQTGRLNIWKRGIEMMLNHPLLGVGIACFISAEGRLYADVGSKWQAAHNSFTEIGAELGFPGLIAFCFLIWSSVENVREIQSVNKELGNDNFKTVTSYSIIGSWVVFIISGFFLSAAYTSSFYFLLALSMSFVSLEKDNKLQINSFMHGNKK